MEGPPGGMTPTMCCRHRTAAVRGATSTSFQPAVWWAEEANTQVAPGAASRALTLAATVVDPSSAIRLRMYANAPGMQLYTGNSLDGKQPVPGVVDVAAPVGVHTPEAGSPYQQYGGLCLEAQAFPNAINTPSFPSSVVRPRQAFSNRVVYEFDCK